MESCWSGAGSKKDPSAARRSVFSPNSLGEGLRKTTQGEISHMEDTTLPHFKRISVTKNENGTNVKQLI
jgi:hypothetical protein